MSNKKMWTLSFFFTFACMIGLVLGALFVLQAFKITMPKTYYLSILVTLTTMITLSIIAEIYTTTIIMKHEDKERDQINHLKNDSKGSQPRKTVN